MQRSLLHVSPILIPLVSLWACGSESEAVSGSDMPASGGSSVADGANMTVNGSDPTNGSELTSGSDMTNAADPANGTEVDNSPGAGDVTAGDENNQVTNLNAGAGDNTVDTNAGTGDVADPGGSPMPGDDMADNGNLSEPADNPGAGGGGIMDPGDTQMGAGGAPQGQDPDNGMLPDNGDNGQDPGAGGADEVMAEPDVDQMGKTNAVPGDSTSVAQDYLRLGDLRVLNNNWGSEDLGCNAEMSVFVNQDSSFGWSFNRGNCDTADSNQKPDFPQIEFGIHPFGIGNHLVTSPEFSSTDLMPIQIKDVQSASVSVQNLNASFQQQGSWNITFEFWLSERHPIDDPNPGVHTELMTFWGWEAGRWPESTGPTGDGAGASVGSGGKNYTLWVQDDTWADGWRYFQFRADDGPQRQFNGTLDVKPFLDYLTNTRGFSGDLWITRLEVGSEIDDNTQGTVQLSGITFQVNGDERSAIMGSN